MANYLSRIAGAIFNKKEPVVDEITPSVVPLPIKFKFNAPTTRSQFQAAAGQHSQVIAQDYDLSVIDRFCDNESIVHQAFSKIQEKATNNGWQFISTDQEAVDYVRRRLYEFSRVLKRPIADFIRLSLGDLVKYSNSFWYKMRDPHNSTGKRVRVGDTLYDPIAAYIHLDASAVIPEKDKFGNVIKYYVGPTHQAQFLLDQGKQVKPEDILHLYIDKSERNNLGMPFIWPTIDDIRVLRHMEENLELMIHKHMFPLYQYVIGTKEQPTEPEEVEKIIIDIENMPSEGAWVTPNRHEIKVIGAEGKALSVDKYLTYFRERVVMGLGIGLVSFGIGAGGSRASSEVIDRNLVEKSKIFQKRLCEWFNDIIIPEILAEGGWDQYSDKIPAVELMFNEIDSDTKIKIENNALQLFNSNAIDYDELRARIGEDMKEPNDSSKLFFNMFGAEKLHEFAMEEARASAVAGGSSAAKDRSSGAAALTKSKLMPSNQHGQKMSPKRQRDWVSLEDAKNPIKSMKKSPNAGAMHKVVGTTYDSARKDVLDAVSAGLDSGASVDSSKQGVGYAMGMTGNAIYQASREYVAGAWDHGYTSGFNGGYITDQTTMRLKAQEVLDDHNEYVTKTLTNVGNDVINILADNKASSENKEEVLRKISSLFDLKKSYVTAAVNTSISKAFNYGRAHAFKDQGHQEAYAMSDEGTTCEDCQKAHGSKIDLKTMSVKDVPPHHTSCECTVELQGESSGQS